MSLWNRLRGAIVRPSSASKEGRSPPDGIEVFWQFWEKHQGDLLAAIDAGTLSEWNGRVNAAVEAVHPNLGWEFGEGKSASHFFCVSAGGNMSLRLVAERWLQRGPGSSKDWEFYAAKQATPGITRTSIAGVALDFADVRVSIKRASWRLELDVEVYHPGWSALSEFDRSVAGFVFLDSTIGEDDVSRWLGCIDFVDAVPADSAPLASLKERVVELSQETETGVILEGKTAEGNRVVSSVNTDVKRIDHLGMDMHIEVRIAFGARDDGLCDSEEADELNALEDELLAELGADAVYVGRRTFEGLRTIHLRAASQGLGASRADAWARRQTSDVEVTSTLDPDWKTMPW